MVSDCVVGVDGMFVCWFGGVGFYVSIQDRVVVLGDYCFVVVDVDGLIVDVFGVFVGQEQYYWGVVFVWQFELFYWNLCCQ